MQALWAKREPCQRRKELQLWRLALVSHGCLMTQGPTPFLWVSHRTGYITHIRPPPPPPPSELCGTQLWGPGHCTGRVDCTAWGPRLYPSTSSTLLLYSASSAESESVGGGLSACEHFHLSAARRWPQCWAFFLDFLAPDGGHWRLSEVGAGLIIFGSFIYWSSPSF